jgi:hypothetical protein
MNEQQWDGDGTATLSSGLDHYLDDQEVPRDVVMTSCKLCGWGMTMRNEMCRVKEDDGYGWRMPREEELEALSSGVCPACAGGKPHHRAYLAMMQQMGRWLRELRRETKITLRQAATLLNVSAVEIGCWERGKKMFTAEQVEPIFAAAERARAAAKPDVDELVDEAVKPIIIRDKEGEG